MKQEKICSVEGCNLKHYCKGYCNKHYYQVKRHGCIQTQEDISRRLSEASKRRERVNAGKMCSIDGCESPAKTKGMCNRHYQQTFHHGRLLSNEECDRSKRAFKGYLCSIEGCDKPRSSKGYCGRHYMHIKRYGRVLIDEEILEHRRQGGIKSRTPGVPRNKYWIEQRKKNRILRKQAIESLGGKCNHCGLVETECLAVYDFHHKDPSTKEASISTLFRHSKPWEEIQPEIEKCILLCSNCHRKVHHDSEE